MLGYVPWWVCIPVYMPGYTSLGTPATLPAHSRRVYTEHARDGVQALAQRVAELTVSDGGVTVCYRRGCYRRRCYRDVHNGDKEALPAPCQNNTFLTVSPSQGAGKACSERFNPGFERFNPGFGEVQWDSFVRKGESGGPAPREAHN